MPTHTLRVKVKPNARTTSLTEQADGSWLAAVRAPPIDGKANAELIALLAKHYGCPKSAVTIRSGVGGRMKLVDIRTVE